MATWSTSIPNLTQEVGAGLDSIKDNFTVIDTAWQIEHAALTGSGASSGTHKLVTLSNASSATHLADHIILNATDVSSKAELHAEHEDNQNIQITATDGTRYGLCGKQFIALTTDDSNINLGTTDGTTAFKINDSGNTNVASIDSDGRVAMAQATAPTVSSGGALYVDTSDVLHFVNSATNFSITGSVTTKSENSGTQYYTTLPNGMILAGGTCLISITGGSTKHFTGFTTIYAFIPVGKGSTSGIQISNISGDGVTINVSVSQTLYFIAIGV